MRATCRASGFKTFIVMVAVIATLSACRSTVGDATAPASSPSAPEKEAQMLTLSSPAFENGGLIPVEYAATGVAGGQNISIPYEWRGAPDGTKSFALAVVDLHPVAHSWVHWMVTGIAPQVSSLARGASGRSMPAGAVEHPNTAGRIGYSGPQPPIGSGNHEYKATLYALDITSPNPSARTLQEFVAAIDGHVLASADCSGFFGR